LRGDGSTASASHHPHAPVSLRALESVPAFLMLFGGIWGLIEIMSVPSA